MFIVEIQNRNTHTSMGFLTEEEWRGKFGFGLTNLQYEAYRFKSFNHANSVAQDFVGDSTSRMIVIKEVD